jgi:hypothetical protein
MSNPLLDMLSGFGQPPNPDEERHAELTKKLHTDFALKGFAEIDKFIKGFCADLNGQYEAIAFVRQYLADACKLPDKIAAQQGLPVEVGRVLAQQVLPMIQYSIDDGANSVYGDPDIANQLFKEKVATKLMTDKEIEAVETELDEIEERLEAEPVPEVQLTDDPDDSPPPKNWGSLDPKNPFGLN